LEAEAKEYKSGNYVVETILDTLVYEEPKYQIYDVDYYNYPIQNINVQMRNIEGAQLNDILSYIDTYEDEIYKSLNIDGVKISKEEAKLLAGFLHGVNPEQMGIYCEDIGLFVRNFMYKYTSRIYPYIHNNFANDYEIANDIETINFKMIFEVNDYAYFNKYHSAFKEILELAKSGEKSKSMKLAEDTMKEIAIETQKISEAIRKAQKEGTIVELPASPEAMIVTTALFNSINRCLPENTKVTVNIDEKEISFVNFDENYVELSSLEMLQDLKDEKNDDGNIVLEEQLANVATLCMMASYSDQYNEEIINAKTKTK